jgi:cobalt-zinc-cadmium efflux system outer membrane protein
MKNFLGAVLIAVLCGCASPPDNRNKVSTALEQRTGHALTESRPGEISVPPTVKFEDGLSEDEAVLLALWNNAAFQETMADLGLSRADLIQAGTLPNPTLSMLIPIGAKPLELTARYPLEILWLRPKRVAAAKLDYEKTVQRLVQSGCDLIRDARLAFIDLALANRRLKLAEESVQLGAQIERLAQARLAAGEVSELEAGAAGVDTLQAQEQSARSRHDAGLARERLRHLLGLGPEHWTALINEPAPAPRFEPSIDLLVTNALAARPDLRAAELGLEAAGKRIGLARTEVFTFAAGVNAKEIGPDFLAGPAIDLPIPIFNQNQGGVALAKAGFEKAARQYFTVRNRIVLEVREAHTRLRQAQESRQAWRERILPPLEEAVRQAEKAYGAGDVSFLLVLEHTRKLTDARAKAAAAAADLQRATAELERNIGGRLPVIDQPVKTNANASQ